ncbi:MAG: TrkH family potassium uptake protein, partial [Candidatus Omnitrophica bacterium]|nr:TrkH family potassium uptake protein [Candidatus Omnitrophota bacterium]
NQIRLILLLKKARQTMIRQIFPKAVTSVRVGSRAVSQDVLEGVSDLFLILGVIIALGTLFLLAFDIDLVTAISAVVACVSNVGPGLKGVGPTQNYGWMPDAVKYFLSTVMIIGRLEIFTFLVLFLPITWKR